MCMNGRAERTAIQPPPLRRCLWRSSTSPRSATVSSPLQLRSHGFVDWSGCNERIPRCPVSAGVQRTGRSDARVVGLIWRTNVQTPHCTPWEGEHRKGESVAPVGVACLVDVRIKLIHSNTRRIRRTNQLTPTQRDLKTRSGLREIDSAWADSPHISVRVGYGSDDCSRIWSQKLKCYHIRWSSVCSWSIWS